MKGGALQFGAEPGRPGLPAFTTQGDGILKLARAAK
jgi:hypothetical protein